MSLLETADAPTTGAEAYETVVAAEVDPAESGTSYAVERDTRSGRLYLTVTREREGKDASVKRHPLAPFARALKLGILD